MEEPDYTGTGFEGKETDRTGSDFESTADEATERSMTLADRDTYRQLAQEAIHALAAATAKLDAQGLRYMVLLAEYRELREACQSETDSIPGSRPRP